MKTKESQLRRLIESCVKEVLDNELKEGFRWDGMKDQLGSDDEFKTWDEYKDLIHGEPDEEKFRQHKDKYDEYANTTIYDPIYNGSGSLRWRGKKDAEKAFMHEPGTKGKASRAAGALYHMGKTAINKGKKALQKGDKK